jgi:CxxC motif-containing protein (DUF1111 family)
MRRFRLLVFVCAATALALPDASTQSVANPPNPQAAQAAPDAEGAPAAQAAQAAQATEAPAGFEGDNGFLAEFCARQAELARTTALSPAIPPDECNMEAAVGEFAGPEGESDGLGPVFNASGCGECHIANPVFGATSQITETRAGMWQNGQFTDHPGGSLIHSRTLPGYYIKFQERVNPSRANVIAIRNTISVLGDGFVEAIDSSTLQAIVNAQPPAQRGQLVNVPVLEEPGQNRFGRFGHKAQQASLLSFSADAYVNEMGITSPMQLDEPSSNGVVVDRDPVPGMDDEGVDVALFALFMRSTKAPPVDTAIASTTDARRGSQLFDAVGCAVCHTRTIVTAPPGTRINGGALKVANALGNKIIHPFSDYALHDVGTGDGIVQNGGPTTRNKIRTTALWGLRARGRLMHDNQSLSFEDAIARHGNQGAAARDAFNRLSSTDRKKLLTFLSSL